MDAVQITPDQELGLILLQDGKPQQIVARYVNLLLNYQYGFASVMLPDAARASAVAQEYGKAIRCAFVIQDHELPFKTALLSLGKQGTVPLYMVLPVTRMRNQRQVCAGLENVFFCAWEKAFSHTEGALQSVVEQAMEQNGTGNLFQDIDKLPYVEAQQRVERRLRHIHTLPTLPEIVVRIMRMVNNPKTTSEELEQVLCLDPAIVMKLLQVIRSPLLGSSVHRGTWTLSDIIVRLGLKKVGAIAQQIKLINSLVRPHDSRFDLRRFWEHSVGSAVIADKLYTDRLVPRRAEIAFSDYWVAALLHDVGKLVLGFFFWDWFAKVVERVEHGELGFRTAETDLGDVASHDRVGQLVLLNADMGEEAVAAVGKHHAPGKDPGPLLCLVHLANNLCKDLGLGCLPGDHGDYDEGVLEAFGIDNDGVGKLRETLGQGMVGQVKALVEQCV
jgi:HD-like signal output (HDOD) protein